MFCRKNYAIEFQSNSLNYEIMKFIIQNGLMETLLWGGYWILDFFKIALRTFSFLSIFEILKFATESQRILIFRKKNVPTEMRNSASLLLFPNLFFGKNRDFFSCYLNKRTCNFFFFFVIMRHNYEKKEEITCTFIYALKS